MTTTPTVVPDLTAPEGLELSLQELEPMEAPGFWTGVSIGIGIVSVVVASASLYTAVSALT